MTHLSLKRHGPLVLVILLVLLISVMPGRSHNSEGTTHAQQLSTIP